MTKADKAIELATVAQQLSQNAMITAHAQGIIFEALVTTLRNQKVLSTEAISYVFLNAAAVVDSAEPTNELEEQSKLAMRDIVRRVAQGFDVTIPPPGQTGIQRKH